MKRCTGAKVGGQEVQQGKSVVSQGKNREKTGSSQQPASERVVVENNTLSDEERHAPYGVTPGDAAIEKAKEDAASGLTKKLNELGQAIDKATQCAFERACSSDDQEQESKAINILLPPASRATSALAKKQHWFAISLLSLIRYKPYIFVVRQGAVRLLSFVMICKFHAII